MNERERILPSGQSQLLINLGPLQYRIEPGPPERRVPFADVWYSGLHQGLIDLESRPRRRGHLWPTAFVTPLCRTL